MAAGTLAVAAAGCASGAVAADFLVAAMSVAAPVVEGTCTCGWGAWMPWTVERTAEARVGAAEGGGAAWAGRAGGPVVGCRYRSCVTADSWEAAIATPWAWL